MGFDIKIEFLMTGDKIKNPSLYDMIYANGKVLSDGYPWGISRKYTDKPFVQIVVPTVMTNRNLAMMLDIIEHETIHAVLEQIEGPMIASALDKSSWTREEKCKISVKRNGEQGYDTLADLDLYCEKYEKVE